MLDSLLSVICPHYCRSCGQIGAILCANCKYDIINEVLTVCPACAHLAVNDGGCQSCRLSYKKAWIVGWREDGLRRLVDDFKFERNLAAGKMLADLLDAALPDLADVIVTAAPTTATHARARGYDQSVLMAKRLARRRHLPYQTTLMRISRSSQRGSSRAQRFEQAKRAFRAVRVRPARYLIIDDVITTGATLEAAAKQLLAAGATEVWVAAVCRQTDSTDTI